MTVLRLVEPSLEWSDQISAYRQACLNHDDPDLIPGSSGLDQYTDPAEWLDRCRRNADPTTVENDWVPAEQWLSLDSLNRLVAMITIRLHLNHAYVAEYAGHIGYSVHPDQRRRGYGTAQLRLALGRCQSLGIDPVLITCHQDNLASRHTIESCGGRFDRFCRDDPHGPDKHLMRFWVSQPFLDHLP